MGKMPMPQKERRKRAVRRCQKTEKKSDCRASHCLAIIS